jgi:hypothetical protein
MLFVLSRASQQTHTMRDFPLRHALSWGNSSHRISDIYSMWSWENILIYEEQWAALFKEHYYESEINNFDVSCVRWLDQMGIGSGWRNHNAYWRLELVGLEFIHNNHDFVQFHVNMIAELSRDSSDEFWSLLCTSADNISINWWFSLFRNLPRQLLEFNVEQEFWSVIHQITDSDIYTLYSLRKFPNISQPNQHSSTNHPRK